MKDKMKIVAGVDVDGEGPPVWEDPNGVERVFKAASSSGKDVIHCVVFTHHTDGSVSSYSNSTNSLIVLGIIEKGKKIILDVTGNTE